LKKKGFKEERVTKVGLYAIGTSTTLESNKSLYPRSLPKSAESFEEDRDPFRTHGRHRHLCAMLTP